MGEWGGGERVRERAELEWGGGETDRVSRVTLGEWGGSETDS